MIYIGIIAVLILSLVVYKVIKKKQSKEVSEMPAGLEIYDSLGQKIYDTANHNSYYKIGEFGIPASIFPQGTSEGSGDVITVLVSDSITTENTFLVKKENIIGIGYSVGHYPAHEQDGDGYVDIVINNGSITAQFKRYPANGTGAYNYIFTVGTYEVWGIKK